jgi:hypothetical protein
MNEILSQIAEEIKNLYPKKLEYERDHTESDAADKGYNPNREDFVITDILLAAGETVKDVIEKYKSTGIVQTYLLDLESCEDLEKYYEYEEALKGGKEVKIAELRLGGERLEMFLRIRKGLWGRIEAVRYPHYELIYGTDDVDISFEYTKE